MAQIIMFRGNTRRIQMPVMRDGAPLDISGGTLIFTAKYGDRDNDDQAVFQLTTVPGEGIEVEDPASGVAIATIDRIHTIHLANAKILLRYDWQLEEADGTVTTLEVGTLTVMPTVTLGTETIIAGGVPLAAAFRPTWHVDNSSGDDMNTGDSPSRALKTMTRYVRLTGYEQHIVPGLEVDVTVHGDMPTTDKVSMRRIVDDATGAWRVHGTTTILVAGVLTSYTPTNMTTGVQATIVDPAFDGGGLGAALEGKIVVFPGINAEARVLAYLGSGRLRIVDPIMYGSGQSDLFSATPGQNEPYRIEKGSRVTMGLLDLHTPWQGGFATWPRRILLENLIFTDVTNFAGTGGFYQRAMAYRCAFQDIQVIGGVSIQFRSLDCTPTALGGVTTFASNLEVQTYFSGSCFRGGLPFFSGIAFGAGSQDANVIASLFSLVSGPGNSQEGRLGVMTTNPGPFSGLHFLDATYVSTHGIDVIYGNQVGTNAVVLARGSKYLYQPGGSIAATGSTGRQIAVGGFLAPTSLYAEDGTTLAACTTWAQLQASPFSGFAQNRTDKSRFAFDTL